MRYKHRYIRTYIHNVVIGGTPAQTNDGEDLYRALGSHARAEARKITTGEIGNNAATARGGGEENTTMGIWGFTSSPTKCYCLDRNALDLC